MDEYAKGIVVHRCERSIYMKRRKKTHQCGTEHRLDFQRKTQNDRVME